MRHSPAIDHSAVPSGRSFKRNRIATPAACRSPRCPGIWPPLHSAAGPRTGRAARYLRDRRYAFPPAWDRTRRPPRSRRTPPGRSRAAPLGAGGRLRTLRRRGDPQTVFISGRSGEGKTALGEHFLGPLRDDRHLVVMAGRCYDRESVPFKALDSLIDALASYLRALPETDAALLMPDDIAVLARVFPVLHRVAVVARA